MSEMAERLMERFEKCEWLHERHYARILGQNLSNASLADLEAMLVVLNKYVVASQGTPDQPYDRNPYKYIYFRGLYDLVSGMIEARQAIPSPNATLDKEHVSV